MICSSKFTDRNIVEWVKKTVVLRTRMKTRLTGWGFFCFCRLWIRWTRFSFVGRKMLFQLRGGSITSAAMAPLLDRLGILSNDIAVSTMPIYTRAVRSSEWTKVNLRGLKAKWSKDSPRRSSPYSHRSTVPTESKDDWRDVALGRPVRKSAIAIDWYGHRCSNFLFPVSFLAKKRNILVDFYQMFISCKQRYPANSTSALFGRTV